MRQPVGVCYTWGVAEGAPYSYIRRVLIALGLASAVVLTGLLVRSTSGALLLIFSGVLFGVFLHTLAAALGSLGVVIPILHRVISSTLPRDLRGQGRT